MREVHITLVGGQPDPVYFVIKHLNPDEVIYICSEDSIGTAEMIKEMTSVKEQHLLCIDPTDAAMIQESVNALAHKYRNDSITVNISSGLKPWSFFFGNKFNSLPNSCVLYIDQNYQLWNYTTMTTTDISYIFDLPTSFKLHKNPLIKYSDFSKYNSADVTALTEIQNARRYNPVEFTELMSILSKEDLYKLRSLENGRIIHKNKISYVEWFYNTSRNNSSVRIVLNKKGKVAEFSIESPNAISLAFNSGWFEYKIAKMISKWQKQRKIYMNCIFSFDSFIDKNEVDIIVDTGTKPLFIECKTQISKLIDIDKFKSVSKNYGGLASMTIFITESKMKNYVKAKCRDNNILYFSLNDYPNQIQAQQALIELLESKQNSIIAR